MNDKRIVELLKERDEETFSKVYALYHKLVYHVIYGIIGNDLDSEDQTQETFLKMFTYIQQCDGERNFKYWLLTIAKNTAKDFMKKREMQIVEIADIDELEAHDSETNYRSMMDEFARYLDEDEYDIIVLHTYHGLKFSEIATLRDKTVSSVNNRYDRGIAKIKKGMSQNEPELKKAAK